MSADLIEMVQYRTQLSDGHSIKIDTDDTDKPVVIENGHIFIIFFMAHYSLPKPHNHNNT